METTITATGLTMLSVAPMGAPEEPLIRETEWGAIRELHARGMSKKAIARQLELDIKTVRKWLKKEWRRRRRELAERGLDPHRSFLEARGPEVGFNGRVLERELREKGWDGHYATLARYVAPLRKAWRGAPEAVVRYETDPGQQAQVDWGSTVVRIGGEPVRIHVFTMVLGYSRRLFARAYPSEGLGALLDAHEKAFSHFGGRTRTILYDNPRTIVLAKDEASGRVTWNATFKDRMDFYGVEVRLCRYYRAQTKGKVESGVKYVKRNALIGQSFASLPIDRQLSDFKARADHMMGSADIGQFADSNQIENLTKHYLLRTQIAATGISSRFSIALTLLS